MDEYRFGIAGLVKALEEFPETKYIVIGGNWNKVKPEAAESAREWNIGIYRFREFLRAINYNNPPLF